LGGNRKPIAQSYQRSVRRWAKNLQTSTLAFDIAQFFPSLNHLLLPNILDNAGFDPKVSRFFSNYLISRKTQYLWNDFISPLFNADVGVGQGSAPILSVVYISLIFHIFEKRIKNLHIPVSLLSFVNNGLIISQEKTFEKADASLLFPLSNVMGLL